MIKPMHVTQRVALAACLGVSSALLATACNNDWSIRDDADAEPIERTDGATAEPTDAAIASEDGARPTPQAEAGADAGAPVGAEAGLDAQAAPPDAQGSPPDLDAQVAAPDADATAPRDATTTPVDTGTTPAKDSGPDTGSTTPTPLCKGVQAAYCNDYEGSDALEFNWLQVTTTSQASLTVSDQGVSGSHALKSALTGAADESAGGAVWLLDAAPGSFRASFDFLPQLSLPEGADSLLFWFRMIEESGDNYPGISLASRQDGNFLVIENYNGTNNKFDMYDLAELPSGWVHVEVEVSSGVQGKVTVRFNGQVAAQYMGLIQAVGVTQSFAVIGLYRQAGPASTALYDNVVLNATR